MHLTSDISSMHKGTKKLSWVLAVFLSMFLQAYLGNLSIKDELSAEDVVPFSSKESSSEVSDLKKKNDSRSNDATKFEGST